MTEYIRLGIFSSTQIVSLCIPQRPYGKCYDKIEFFYHGEEVTEPKLSFEKQAWKTIAVKRNVLQKARIFESQIPLVKAKYIMGLLLLQRVGLL